MTTHDHEVVVECHDRSPLTLVRFGAGLALLIVTLADVVPAQGAGGIVRVGFLVLGCVLALEGGWHLLRPRPPWWVAVRDDSLEWGRGETPSASIRLSDVRRVHVDASSGTAEGVYFDIDGKQRVLPLGLMSYSDIRNVASAIRRRFPDLPLEYSGEIPAVEDSSGEQLAHRGLQPFARLALGTGAAIAVGLGAVLLIKQPWRGLQVPACVGLPVQECIVKTGATIVSKGPQETALLLKDDTVWAVVVRNEKISLVRELRDGKATAMGLPDAKPSAAAATATEEGQDELGAEPPPPDVQSQEGP